MAKDETKDTGAASGTPTIQDLMLQMQKLMQRTESLEVQNKELKAQADQRNARPNYAGDEKKLDRQVVEDWLNSSSPVGEFYYRNCERKRLVIAQATETTRTEGGAVRQQGKDHITAQFYRYGGIGAELWHDDDPCKDLSWSRFDLRSIGDMSISAEEIAEYKLRPDDYRAQGRLTYTEALSLMYQSDAFKAKEILDGDSFKDLCRARYQNDWQSAELLSKTNEDIEKRLGIKAAEAGPNFNKLGKMMPQEATR